MKSFQTVRRMCRSRAMVKVMTMAVVLTASAASLLIADCAQAQFGQATGIQEIMQPEFYKRDITVFAEELRLDPSQQVIVESLFDSYNADFQEGLEALRGSFENIKDQIDPNDPQQAVAIVFAPFETWRADREALGDQFLARVHAILTPAQRNDWDDFLLRLRRLKELPKGTLSGEKLDLITVVRDLHLPRMVMHEAQPALDGYAIDLDAALRAREQIMSDSQQSMIKMIQVQDTEQAIEVIRAQIQARVRVRDVNLSAIETIAEALPADQRDNLRARAYAAAYPRVFRVTTNEEMIEQAHVAPNLTSDQQQAVAALQQEFTDAMSALRQRLVDSVRQHEPASEINRAEMYAARARNERLDRIEDPSVELFRERETLGGEYVERLRALLSDEQFSELPGGESYLAREQRRQEREAAMQEAGEEARQYAEENGALSDPGGVDKALTPKNGKGRRNAGNAAPK